MRLIVLALLALLGWLAPSPAASIEVLRGPGSPLAGPADVATVLVALVAVAGWALLGWLVVIAGLQLLSAIPGCTGRLASGLASALAPIAVRRGLAVLLGLSLTTSAPATAWAAAATPATAAPAVPAAAAAPGAADLPDLDWPVARTLAGPAEPAPPGPAGPLGTVEAAVEPAPTTAGPPAGDRAARSRRATSPDTAHVVAPGESLWSIAADHLGPAADASRVAATWPRWWQANRADIGANPHLIHPGTRLIPPTPSLESEQP